MKCRPGKWLLPAILGAGVPFLGAWLWNTTSLDSALLEKAKASLASAGFDWVNISLDGRDAILTGEGPDDAATQKAAAALLGEYGIRRVDTSAITLAAPLPVPSTPGLVTNNVASTLTGTWAEGIASSLAVGLGDRKFTLGTDKELASDGKGNWTLTPPADLADGSYDVTVEEIDKFKRVVTGAAPGKFVLDRKAPAAPTVDPLVSTSPISRLTGTWAEGDATHLKITVDGTAYEKGAAAALHTESGKWTLDLPAPLGEGPHKVMTESSDEAGNAAGSAPDVQVVVDTTPSRTPTVDNVMATGPVSVISGTWDDADARQLKVKVDESTYVKGTDGGLSVSGGTWKLALSPPLGEGKHTVSVETVDAAGNISAAVVPGAVNVDATPPAAPTVNAVASGKPVDTLTGTYDSKDATTLTVKVGDNTYLKGTYTGLTTSGNDWTLAISPPVAGSADVVVETADAAGNVSTATVKEAIIVDSMPPAAPAVDKLMVSGNASVITGTWDEKNARDLKVTVDGTPYQYRTFNGLSSAAGKWTLALPAPLGPGTHGVTVETADAAGNISTAVAEGSVVVVAPLKAPAVNKLAGNNPAPAIAGTFDPAAASLAVAVGGKVYVLGKDQNLTSDGNGNWSLTPVEPLKDGIYDVVAVETDSAGLRTSDETVAEVTVDATPPTVPTVDIIAGNKQQPVISGTMDKTAKSLAVAVGGKVYVLGKDANLKSTPEGIWSLTPTEPLPEGIYDVVVVTADEFGNKSSDQTLAEVNVDLTGPKAPAVDKSGGSNQQPVITGTMAQGTRTLAVSIGGKVYVLGKDQQLTVDQSGKWTLKVPEPLKDGVYDVVVVASDIYGNRTSDETVAEVTVDTTPPVAPTVDIISGNKPQPKITGTMGTDVKSLAVAVNGKVYVLGKDASLVASPGGVWSLTPEAPLPEGIFDVVVVTADEFGNKSSDQTLAEVTVDLTGPKAPTVSPLTDSNAQPAITGTMAMDTRTLAVSIDGKVYVLGKDANLTTDGAGNWTLKLPQPLKPGSYDVVAVASDIYDNRTSDETMTEVEITPPPDTQPTEALPPAGAPTVNSEQSTVTRPRLTGTWPEAAGVGLKITVAGASYVLGKDEALTSDGKGAWTLAIPVPLKDGVYDVIAEATGSDGKPVADITTSELTIDAAGPAAPTVDLYAGETSPAKVTGTWAEGDAVKLAVTLNGRTAVLGEGNGLISDGKGNWTLDVPETLPAASYDVVAVSADKMGRISADQTKFEILVKAVEQAQPVPQPTMNLDCGGELMKLLVLHPLTFDLAKSKVRAEDQPVIAEAAKLINSCPDLHFEIAGHTDSTASTDYNQALSERRAVAVRKALVAAGVDHKRMTAVGFGETRPVMSNDTRQGRALNRRIEITVLK